MVTLATLNVLGELEQEMSRAGRRAERQALREVLSEVASPGHDMLTTGEAARRLGVAIPTIKRWIRRGALDGVPLGTRWLVSAESVRQALHLRESLASLDDEGNPEPDDIRETCGSDRLRRAS